MIGRFVTADSIVEDYFAPQTLNRYSYVRNNPLKYTDPSGHTTVGEAIDEKAMAAASEGRSAALYGWSFAKAAWTYFGAESVSKVADKAASGRSDVGTGDYVGAAVDVLTLGKGGGAVIAGKKLGGKLLPKAKGLIKSSKNTTKISKKVKVRKEPGADKATSHHIIEKQGDETISVTHQVKNQSGKTIHQHQTHIGKHGSQRRFPDEWVEHPTIRE